jgi:hypothetical protein
MRNFGPSRNPIISFPVETDASCSTKRRSKWNGRSDEAASRKYDVGSKKRYREAVNGDVGIIMNESITVWVGHLDSQIPLYFILRQFFF